MRYIATLLLFSFLLSPAAPLWAQNLIYGEDALAVDLDPAYPTPGKVYTVKANDYALPVRSSSLRWIIDGKAMPNYDNERSLTLTAKKVSQKTTIELIVDLASGGTLRATRVVEPVYLDIIIEPQTRTPAFYQGRALPSIGSTINATALVNGNEKSPSELIFTWRLNNDTLEGGAVRGNNSLSFVMPRGQSATLSVEVRKVDGSTLTRKTIDLRSVSPELSFYEVNTLYGLSTKAISDTQTLLGTSLTVLAEPYYLDLETYNDPDFVEWQIDNINNTNQSGNPYEVTIASTGATGNSNVEFHVRNTVQVLQGAKADFRLTY